MNPDVGAAEKLASVVARDLEAYIAASQWPVGDRLGSEAELVERFAVSRATMREAIRLLERRQVVRSRSGPGGGVFVSAPASSAVAGAISGYLEFASVGSTECFQARLVLERRVARLAAAHPVVVAEVEPVRAGVSDVDSYHHQLAGRAANPALAVFVDALVQAAGDRSPAARLSSRARASVRRDHEVIEAAVTLGDADAAADAVEVHLDRMQRWARQQSAGTSSHRVAGSKLPERLARLIRDRIVDAGCAAGTVLGSEQSLIGDYGVSRAGLREAVRILEFYGLARMRPGPGGGLVVGQADPTATIERVVAYLEYLRFAPQDLHEARSAVEEAVVDATARVLDLHSRDRLLSDLDAIERQGPHALHLLLSELSGNRVLALFTRILVEFTALHAHGPEDERDHTEAAVRLAHRRITAAVAEGRPELAVARMRRHLDALVPWIEAPGSAVRTR